MKPMKLSISPGNTKMGGIPSISLTPGASCRPGVACYSDGCYARRIAQRLPSAAEAWARNLEIWRDHPRSFEAQLTEFLATEPERFRYHVAGDIPDKNYYHMILWLASEFLETEFLVFTKRWDILTTAEMRPNLPNLSIVVSVWPGEPGFVGLPTAWLYEDQRRPTDALECRGGCRECGECWELVRTGGSVCFRKH